MTDDAARQDALLVNLIMVFKSAAMQQMGKIINPITGKVEKDLDQARFSIDTLEMLKVKTRGNLANDLERLLDSTLLELRMNYVEEAEAEKAEKEETGAEGEAAKKADQQGEAKDGSDASAAAEAAEPGGVEGKPEDGPEMKPPVGTASTEANETVADSEGESGSGTDAKPARGKRGGRGKPGKGKKTQSGRAGKA